MKTHHPANERVKRRYFNNLAEAPGHSEPTIDAVAKAIARFEAYTQYKDFKAFHIEQAKGRALEIRPWAFGVVAWYNIRRNFLQLVQYGEGRGIKDDSSGRSHSRLSF
jgi:hypothetical protein